MAFSQPFVVRVYFSNETEATEAQTQLAQNKVRSDYVKASKDEPGRYKLIFTESDLNTASSLVKKLTRSRGAEFFSPQIDWAKGFTPFTSNETAS